MIVWIGTRTYCGATASQVVRAIEQEKESHPLNDDSVRGFLTWSLGRLKDRLPRPDSNARDVLGDETLALYYLCLLENYGLAQLWISPAGEPAA
jgi:hypothetical protein